jgi:uncharacterized protein (TIGR03000 family)
MYSVVLLMTMTTGAEAPEFFSSCSCYSSCGCYSSCYGCYGYSCHGCSMPDTGCNWFGCSSCAYAWNCSGCSGCWSRPSCHSWCSAPVIYYGCCGCCNGPIIYSSCCGCSGYSTPIIYSSCCGCCGYFSAPAPAAPPEKKPETIRPPKDEKKEKEKGAKTGLAPAPAVIVVSLPAGAKLSFNGVQTKSNSNLREFESPDLSPAMIYQYTVKAEYEVAGKTEVKTEIVEVRANQTAKVEFSFDTKVAGK